MTTLVGGRGRQEGWLEKWDLWGAVAWGLSLVSHGGWRMGGYENGPAFLMVQPVTCGQQASCLDCKCSKNLLEHTFLFLINKALGQPWRLIQLNRPLTRKDWAEIFRAKCKRCLQGLTPAASHVPHAPVDMLIWQLLGDNSLGLTPLHWALTVW